jgi:hypothetical protein
VSAHLAEEARHGLARAGYGAPRRDVGERHEDEESRREARMGKYGRRPLADDGVVEEEIEIEGTRAVPGPAPPARGPLEALEVREQLLRREPREAGEDGIDERGLWRAADRTRPVERGETGCRQEGGEGA